MSAAEDLNGYDPMSLWEALRTPNPAHTKSFKRGGGFSGTAVSGMAIALMLTEQFGPCGIGWKVIITKEDYVPGHTYYLDDGSIVGNAITHVLRGYLTYLCDGQWAETSEQFGQTMYVSKNKYGMVTDEEAPKKSATDLMSKCASLIGCAADIHLGLWDDNKYVNKVRETFEASTPEGELIAKYIELVEAAKDRGALEATLLEKTANNETWQAVLERLAKTHIAQVQKAKQHYAKKLRAFAPTEAAE